MAKTRREDSATMHRTRSPFGLGWEAARVNALPALIIQTLMLMLLVSFYTSQTAFTLLSRLAELKRTHDILFVVIASVTAGALIPELFLIAFFQRGRPGRRNLRNLLFTVPVWGLDGALVDLLYRSQAAWFGDVATLPVVMAKICVDQLGYNPFFAAPFGVLTYEWKNSGISWQPIVIFLRGTIIATKSSRHCSPHGLSGFHSWQLSIPSPWPCNFRYSAWR